jgi:hypothetical protein
MRLSAIEARLKAERLLENFFRGLRGAPAWGVSVEYGSWLSLNFGNPHLEVREAVAEAQSPMARRRTVFVKGDHRLWIDLCTWDLFAGSRRRFHSEQRRSSLRRAAAPLNGQIITTLLIKTRPFVAEFQFDAGSRLVMKPYPRAPGADELWHLYTGRRYLCLAASRHVRHGILNARRLAVIRCPSLEISI